VTRAFLAACLLLPCLAAAQAEGPKHFLWEVQSMTNRLWLYGTIHAGKAEWFPLPEPVERALAESQVLVVEADVTDLEAMAKTTGSLSYPPPDELSKHVPAGDYERFKAQLEKQGIPERAVKRLKPFPASSLLMFSEWGRQGFQPTHGIDSYLLRKAKAAKKAIVELEGVEAQAQLIDSLTEDEQRAAFAGTVAALESGLTGEQIDGMVKAWQSGDAFLLLEVARRYNEKTPGARELEEKFIWSRHDAMVKKIEEFLNKSDRRHFVAVGSLHLAGPRGLVELLRKKGYLVRQR
jgi:uncharacterized protein